MTDVDVLNKLLLLRGYAAACPPAFVRDRYGWAFAQVQGITLEAVTPPQRALAKWACSLLSPADIPRELPTTPTLPCTACGETAAHRWNGKAWRCLNCEEIDANPSTSVA